MCNIFRASGIVTNMDMSNSLWIGGHQSDVTGSWTWSDSGVAFTYNNWNHGEPNDSGRCAQMYGMHKWDDTACSNSISYVCEMDHVFPTCFGHL